jgi:hypothetical protein
MTYPDTDARDTGARDTDQACLSSVPDSQAGSLDGIPAEVLFGMCSYDTDSAGGCG